MSSIEQERAALQVDAWDHIYALDPQKRKGAFKIVQFKVGAISLQQYQDWTALHHLGWDILQEQNTAAEETFNELKSKRIM